MYINDIFNNQCTEISPEHCMVTLYSGSVYNQNRRCKLSYEEFSVLLLLILKKKKVFVMQPKAIRNPVSYGFGLTTSLDFNYYKHKLFD